MRASAVVTCPRCGTQARMLRIVFGLPTYETFQAAERGELALSDGRDDPEDA